MKRNYNLISLAKRFFPLVTAAMVLVCCISFPASAEALDYRDYEKYVTVDGDKDLVTVSFPQEWFSGVFTNSSGAGLAWWSGWEFDYEPDPTVTSRCWAYIAPFGGPTASTSFSYSGLYLSLDNIPADSSWHISFMAWVDDEPNDLTIGSSQVRSFSVLDSYATVSEYLDVSPSHDDFGDSQYLWSIDGRFPSGADGWFSQIILVLDGVEDVPVHITVTSFTVTLSISSLYRLQEQTGETNDLLDEVNRQLEEQGKTMNDILNGTPEQNESANNAAGVLGDKGEQLGNLAGDIQPNKPDLDSVNTNVSDLVPSTGLNSLTSAISPIANNELVIKILVMVATLILVSYVLFGKRG